MGIRSMDNIYGRLHSSDRFEFLSYFFSNPVIFYRKSSSIVSMKCNFKRDTINGVANSLGRMANSMNRIANSLRGGANLNLMANKIIDLANF